jgi:hypothetical protein
MLSIIMKCSLSEEIKDFIRWIEPSPLERAMRRDLIDRIQSVVLEVFPKSDVRFHRTTFPLSFAELLPCAAPSIRILFHRAVSSLE